jgi:2-keto-3-deoxy-L-rhamnonate aldolase RhmA
VKKNKVKEILKRGGTSVGHIVMEFKTPGIAQILARAGFDFVIFDCEHTGFSMETLTDLIAFSKAADIVTLFRPPSSDYHLISRPLDAGAKGLMIPRVESREEVEKVIETTKYPPWGKRGSAFGIAHDDYAMGDVMRTMQEANDETLVIIQIENVRALDNIDEILSVVGVDVGWVGHFDLTASMGIPGRFDHPKFKEAIDRIVEACARHNVAPGIMAADVETTLMWMDKGFRCLSFSIDIGLFLSAGMEALGRIRKHPKLARG